MNEIKLRTDIQIRAADTADDINKLNDEVRTLIEQLEKLHYHLDELRKKLWATIGEDEHIDLNTYVYNYNVVDKTLMKVRLKTDDEYNGPSLNDIMEAMQ